jgi:hypothetical protein
MRVRIITMAVTAFIFAVASISLTYECAQAQVLYGTLVGNVKDASGGVIQGATVTAVSRETNYTGQTLANGAGQYAFRDLRPGTYTVKISVPGFKEFVRTDVSVTINSVKRIDATLEVGSPGETVTVSAQALRLQTDKADVHREIPVKEVTELPLRQYRNYQSLIDLVPGTTPSAFQNAQMDTPAMALATHINGVAGTNNNTRLDGALNIIPWLPSHSAYVAPQESVQTVSISTNSFDAEQGIAGGAAIAVQTKSGTNEFHGVAFEYHRNSAFSARHFFTPEGSSVPKSLLNMFGGNLGGPIRKDRLFFFVNAEALRQRDNYSALQTVATGPMRTGDLSAMGTPIYDPATGDSAGKGRTAFANGVIPATRLDAISLKMLSLVPMPNVPGAAWLNNYYASAPWAFNRDVYDFKVDWARSAKNTIWLKYSLMNSLVDGQYALGEAFGPGLPFGGGGKGTVRVHVGTIGAYYAASPGFLVDGTIGMMRYVNHVRHPDMGVNYGLDVLGIPGTNGPDIRQSGKPQFVIGGGYTSLGMVDVYFPADRWDYTYTYSGNATWSRGRHEIRFGPDAARFGMNHWQPEAGGGPRGSFHFDGSTTALNGGPAPRPANYMAAFLLGLASSVRKSLQYYDPMSTREWQVALYFRDRWQVRSNLTVTLGVRWEYYPIVDRGFHGIERYDPDTNKVYIGGYRGVEWNAGTTASRKLFAPRAGIAYRLGRHGVVRAGYGITFDPFNLGRPMRSPYPAVPQLVLGGPGSFVPYGRVSDGIPPMPVPDIAQGIIDIPGTYQTSTLPKGPFHRGYIQSWNLTYERTLLFDLIWNVGYVATRGTNISENIVTRAGGGWPVNNPPLGTGRAGRPLNVKFGRSVNTTILQPWANSVYDSLQTSLERRFTKGLMLKSIYTWSHCIQAQSPAGPFGLPELFYLNRGPCGFDRRHNFRTAWIYELPWGPDSRWFRSGTAGAVLGGWQVNGIFSAVTGKPFGVSASNSLLNTDGTTGQTPDLVKPEVKKLGDIGVGSPFYDPSAFRPVMETRYGNYGASTLTGPGIVNLDLGLFRAFRLTENKGLQFRAEVFNLTNTPHFNNPSTSNTSATNMSFNPDGSIKSVGNFLSITTAAEDARCFRFGLRFSF